MAAFAPLSQDEASQRSSPSRSRHMNRPSSSQPRRYPSGPCNFRDLSTASNSDSCGCQWFCLNDVSQILFGNSSQDTTNSYGKAACFCGHHACFHQLEPTISSQVSAGAEIGGSIQIHGSAVFRPQTERQEWADDRVGNLGYELAGRQQGNVQRPPAGNLKPLYRKPYHQIPLEGSHAQKTRPSSVQSNDCYQRANQTGLGLYWSPNVPYDNASQMSSRQSAAVISAQRTRGGATTQIGLGFQPSPSRLYGNPVPRLQENATTAGAAMLPPDQQQNHFAESATEVATPSNAGTPALRGPEDDYSRALPSNGVFQTASDPFQARSNLEYSQSPVDRLRHQSFGPNDTRANAADVTLTDIEISILKHFLSSTPNLGTSLRNLSKRLEALETESFSHVSEQAVHDFLENFEANLIELSTRVGELERNNEDTSSYDGRISVLRDNQAKFSAATLEQLGQRLQTLESMAPPTLSQPWEVEVIFLPWGQTLKGIWLNQEEASQASHVATQDASGRSLKRSVFLSYNTSTSRQNRATQDWVPSNKDWLSPKACGATQGVGGKVYERLKSRGFVRQITFAGRDATTIYTTIVSAFGDVFDQLGRLSETSSHDVEYQAAPLGLKAEFVPLRKVHKSNMLRFLSSAELATPSLWSSDFLDSTIFMKAAGGQKKFFITQPSAYVQAKEGKKSDHHNEWTWQRLRELPRYSPESRHDQDSHQSCVAEADALEPCWTFDAGLDETPSVHSSIASSQKHSFQKTSSFTSSHPPSPEQILHDTMVSESEEDSDADQLSTSQQSIDELQIPSSPRRHQGLIASLSEAIPVASLQPSHYHRTHSLPLADHDMVTVPKRQAASFEPSSSPVKLEQQQHLKRRRLSRDVEDIAGNGVRGPGNNMTPRGSREPPSPHQSDGAMDIRANWFDRRATTPTAYATPFSNNAVLGWVGSSDAMDDDEEEDDDYQDNNSGGDATNADHANPLHGALHEDDEEDWHGLAEDDDDEAGEFDVEFEGGVYAEPEDDKGHNSDDDDDLALGIL